MRISDGSGEMHEVFSDIQYTPMKPKREARQSEEHYKMAPRSEKKAKDLKVSMQKNIKRIAPIALASVVAFGGVKAYSEYVDSKNTITLAEALENNMTLEQLGIDEDIEQRLAGVKQTISEQGDLTNIEIINLSEEINDLRSDMLKMKVAKALNVDSTTIDFEIGVPDGPQVMIVQGDNKYYEQSVLDKLSNPQKTSISRSLGNYVYDVISASDLNAESFSREKAIKECQKEINEIDKLAAKKVVKDEDTITVKGIRRSQLEQYKEQENAKRQEVVAEAEMDER